MRKLITSSIFVTLIGLALAAPAAAVGSSAELPIPDLFEVVLDEDNGRLYLTAGYPHDVLVVTDLMGAPVTTITGLEGASGLTLSEDGASVFVALADANAVAEIDAATLTETARYPLPADVCPGSVAATAGYLAIGHSCSQYAGIGGYGGIGILDPATGAWNPLEAPGPFYKPYVTAAAGSNGLFVTADLGLSPTTLYTIGVYDGIGDTVASLRTNGGNLRDLAMSPDGGLVVQASGAPYQHDAYGVPALNLVLSYDSTTYPNAAAWASTGLFVATGTDSAYDFDVRVHHRDSPAPIASFDLGERLADRGLAITADGSTVFAIGETSDTFTLHRLTTGPVTVASTLALTAGSPVVVGTSVEISGTLAFADGSDASGKTITITRSYADVVESLPATTTAAGGSFSMSDTPTVATTVTYTASFTGDAVYEPSEATTDVTVAKRATDLSIDVQAATGKKSRNKVVVTAELGETYTNRDVTITAADRRGSRIIASGTVGPDGTLSAAFRIRRTTTFTVTFAGDAWYLPASESATWVR